MSVLQRFLDSGSAIRLALWLGRVTPKTVGHALADAATGVIARQHDSPLVRTVRENLRVVLGADTPDELLECTVRQVFHHNGRVLFDLYRALGRGPEALAGAVEVSPKVEETFAELRRQGRGLMVAGGHLSNFDLALLSLGTLGYRAVALAFASPTAGYDVQNEIRKATGQEFLPIDVSVLRKAVTILRSGGIIMTGVDRPVPSGGEWLSFFGQPAYLPVGHVRLALQTDVPIAVLSCEYRPQDDTYFVHVARVLEMERIGSRDQNVTHNAQRVIQIIERLIRAHPDQWMMFYPVWGQQSSDQP
jgi:lauroyl/myristoyl acyltransferase